MGLNTALLLWKSFSYASLHVHQVLAKRLSPWILKLLPRKRKAILEKNLKLVFPQWNEQKTQDFIQKNILSVTTSLLRISTIWKHPSSHWGKKIELEGVHHLTSAEKSSTGLIILTPHFNHAETLGQLLIENLHQPSYYIYKPLKQQKIENFIIKSRGAFNIKSSEALKIIKTLKKGQTIFMLPDQYMIHKNCADVSFLGVKTKAITAPAKLASMTNATLLIAYIKETPSTYKLMVEPPLNPQLTGNIEEDTQFINHQLSNVILSQPEHYFWLHNRFKTHFEQIS
ncbi:MAG TPA: hypothetical protein QF353_02935 [Gammaproteobacteria bacterium]|nr:hypothetical protein [Gammaproteobacteria bacterium]